MNDTKDMPEVLRNPVTEKTKFTETVEGKDYKGESFTEAEIPANTMKRIAPLVYWSPDNNKVYLVPFTIQFEFGQFANLLAQMSVNLGTVIDEIQKSKVGKKDNEEGKSEEK